MVPDPGFVHLTSQHADAISGLAFGVMDRKGYLMLTGEPGLGKTTALCALSELLADHRPGPAELCLTSDLAENVLQLARQLTPILRSALQLRYLDGLSIREMTDVLGVAEGTVKARIARARAKLRSLMRQTANNQRRRISKITMPER